MSPAALKGQEAGPVGGLPGLLPLVLGTSQAAEKEIVAQTSCLFRNCAGTNLPVTFSGSWVDLTAPSKQVPFDGGARRAGGRVSKGSEAMGVRGCDVPPFGFSARGVDP